MIEIGTIPPTMQTGPLATPATAAAGFTALWTAEMRPDAAAPLLADAGAERAGTPPRIDGSVTWAMLAQVVPVTPTLASGTGVGMAVPETAYALEGSEHGGFSGGEDQPSAEKDATTQAQAMTVTLDVSGPVSMTRTDASVSPAELADAQVNDDRPDGALQITDAATPKSADAVQAVPIQTDAPPEAALGESQMPKATVGEIRADADARVVDSAPLSARATDIDGSVFAEHGSPSRLPAEETASDGGNVARIIRPLMSPSPPSAAVGATLYIAGSAGIATGRNGDLSGPPMQDSRVGSAPSSTSLIARVHPTEAAGVRISFLLVSKAADISPVLVGSDELPALSIVPLPVASIDLPADTDPSPINQALADAVSQEPDLPRVMASPSDFPEKSSLAETGSTDPAPPVPEGHAETAIPAASGALPQPAQASVATFASAPTAPVAPPDSIPQIILQTLSTTTEGTLELTLSPQELGPLRIEFLASADGLRVTLAAERPEAMELIRRHAGELLAELRQAGWAQASLSFGQWAQGRGDHGRGEGTRSAPRAMQDGGSDQARFTTPRPAVWQGGLNLRF